MTLHRHLFCLVYSCGEEGSEVITNFINPGYPASERTSGNCHYKLRINSPKICQVGARNISSMLNC